MNFSITHGFSVESARFLPNLPVSHPCSKMHGHSFKLNLKFVGPLKQPEGWLIDFNDIKKTVQPVLSRLDHCVLNEVAGLENPTSENLAFYVFSEVKKSLPSLAQVTVSETPETSCTYPAL